MSINYLFFFQTGVFFLLLAICWHPTLCSSFRRAHLWCLPSVSIWINSLESCSWREMLNLLTESQFFQCFVPVVDLSVYEIYQLISLRSVSFAEASWSHTATDAKEWAEHTSGDRNEERAESPFWWPDWISLSLNLPSLTAKTARKVGSLIPHITDLLLLISRRQIHLSRFHSLDLEWK